mmetsp:Transcript_9322/g.8231  ORF Transcript_9322/g.8231 Transcript_9322/m.8231 type:complete len:159 (+) Transcript_9322:202-678(+)
MLLLEKLDINPIMFYECMLLSPVDKVFEFNDKAIFYNIVIPREYIDDDPNIVRVIRMKGFCVFVVKEFENDLFKLSNEIADKFKFKQVMTHLDPHNMMSDKKIGISSNSSMSDMEEVYEKGEVGNVIIQRISTILPQKHDEKASIDYILFWMSHEGLK